MEKNKKFEYLPILKNAQKYENVKLQLLNTACKQYGKKVTTEFSLPKSFDFTNLTEEYFTRTYTQKMAIPLSDQNFKMLTKLPKKAINIPFSFNTNKKHITGQYLVGAINSKPVLYALSIIQEEKNPNEQFNIKLDVCINGQEWIQLARLDSCGSPHANYYDEKNFAKNDNQVEQVPTPHLHYCIERSQVLNGVKFDYMPAKHIDVEKIKSNNQTTLQSCLNYFLNHTAINEKLTSNCLNCNDYSSYLFENNNFVYSYSDAQKLVNNTAENSRQA